MYVFACGNVHKSAGVHGARGIICPGGGVAVVPWRCWELISGPPQEQYMFVTTKKFSNPLSINFKTKIYRKKKDIRERTFWKPFENNCKHDKL